jgi:hypothetical protein
MTLGAELAVDGGTRLISGVGDPRKDDGEKDEQRFQIGRRG